MKSLFLAYCLLFMTGPFGMHLVYCERPKQAFVWATTFGVLGIGLLYDLFALPRYVGEINNFLEVKHRNSSSASQEEQNKTKNKAPSIPKSHEIKVCAIHPDQFMEFYCVTCQHPACARCSILGACKGHEHADIKGFNNSSERISPIFWFGKARMTLQYIYACFLSALVPCAVLPMVDKVPLLQRNMIWALASAIGASSGSWIVSSIGNIETDLFIPFIWTLLFAFGFVSAFGNLSPFLMALVPIFVIQQLRLCRKSKVKYIHPLVRQMLNIISLFSFFVILAIAAYNTGTVLASPKDNSRRYWKVRISLKYFIQDLPLVNLLKVILEMDAIKLREFWSNYKNQAIIDQSYEIFNLDQSANFRDVKKKFRDLSSRFHPDIYKGDERKKNEEFYFKIVRAFEVLEDLYKKP